MGAATRASQVTRSTRVPASVHAPARARAWIGWLAPYLAPERADDVGIVLSELVTNAVLHAGLEEGDPIHLSARVHHDRVSIEVRDSGAGIPVPRRRTLPPPASPGGRGLLIAEGLTSRLLIDGPRGLVTFELPREAPER